MSHNLPADLTRENLWLHQPPGPYIARPVWTVVCTLFSHCCLYGSKSIYHRAKNREAVEPDRLSARIVTLFWALLRQYFSDLTALSRSPERQVAKGLEVLINSLQAAEGKLPPDASLPFAGLQDGQLVCLDP